MLPSWLRRQRFLEEQGTMSGAGSWEAVLTQISSILVPLGDEFGGQTAATTAATMSAAVSPFLALVIINLVVLSMRHALLRITIALAASSIALLMSGLGLQRLLVRRATKRLMRYRLWERHPHREKRRGPQTDASFKSWDQFRKGTVFGSFGGDIDEEAKQALAVLGLHAFSTQCELRKAYLELMKIHHPDRFMDKPSQLEEAQNTTVKIREAYDKISKQFCQTQC